MAGSLDPSRIRSQSDRNVRARARRLQREPATRTLGLRLAMHAPVLILGLASMAFLIAWIAGAGHAIALADYCPY